MSTAEATPELTIVDHGDRAFLGHPRGLAYLAFTEAWERFSFYGMQTLLVLYMVKYLLLPGHAERVIAFAAFRALPIYRGLEGQALASAIFGTYSALVYLTPIFGGLLADRLLGKRRTVLLGAIVMAAGHFLMAFQASFLFALLCLVIGSGMLKGNIASQVGSLYKPDDLRRADAFQIFYLGINAGVIVSPLVVGALAARYGWGWGFGTAGVGMLVALAIYVAGQRYLPDDHLTAARRAIRAREGRGAPLTRQEWLAIGAIVLLLPVLAAALLPNEEIFNVYLVWADAHFRLTLFGLHLPTGFLISFDSVVSVAMLAIVSLFYRWYGQRWREPDDLTKMAIGSAFSVGGMGCLIAAALTAGPEGRIGLFWPAMFHLVNSIGFAHILPVSLALFARLAPKKINATVIGIYYLAFFVADYLVGQIGEYYQAMPVTTFWLLHAACAGVAGVLFLLFRLLLSRRMMGDAPVGALAGA